MCLRNEIRILVAVIILALPATGAGQQNDQGGQQGQPATPVSAGEPAQASEQGQAPPVSADARSFAGAEGFSVQPSGRLRGYFLPSFQFLEMGDSNFSVSAGQRGFETINTLVGRLDYHKAGRHFQTTTEYLGGAAIYNHHSELNSTMQQFGITESYKGRRWSLLFDDRAAYLPESAFGYGGFGFMGALGSYLGGATGSSLSNLNPILNPNAALLTGRGPRILNNTVAQVQYLAGVHSALTLAVSFGLLHFRTPGLVGSRNGTVMLGYSHSFTARDYIGLNYAIGEYRFPSLGSSFTTHIIQMSYGHRISGRMAVEVGAGPQINVIKNPITGSTSRISWAAHGSLDYRARNGNLALFYFRNTTNGGGVLAGAITDNFSTTWSMPLARHWSGSLGPGYAHNRSLPQTTSGQIQRTFNSAYVRASLNRSLGRHANMFFSYNFQTQDSNVTPCLIGNCGASLQRHVVGFGFDFHPRQIMID